MNKCPKCNGDMEEGLISTPSANGYMQPSWGTEIKGQLHTLENTFDVKSYRCEECGYVESYAK